MTQYFLITGSRDFPWSEHEQIYSTLDSHLRWHPVTVMINGLAKGADTICHIWASENGVPIEEYPADWNKYGKGAGPVRNKQMLNRLMEKKSSIVYAFFYGDPSASKGTANMVSQCQSNGIEPIVKVVPRVQV
jgi:hypothetical protein